MAAEDQLHVLLALTTLNVFKYICAYLWRKKRTLSYEYVGEVSALKIHPLKSCAPMSLQSVMCTKDGFSHDGFTDRHWMVVDSDGLRVNINQEPKMAQIRPSFCNNMLCLDAPGMPTLKLEKNPTVDSSLFMSCKVVGMKIVGMSCGKMASDWINRYLGKEGLSVVVSTSSMRKRDICDRGSRPWINSPTQDDRVTFSDFSACNIASESSLQDLNKRLTSPVDMGNFRPTLVVKGSAPFDEDSWKEIKIGDKVTMRLLEPTPRCLTITVDPNGKRDPYMEPLKTLRTFRKSPLYGNDPLFGVTTTVDHGGVINVGDPVYVLRKEEI